MGSNPTLTANMTKEALVKIGAGVRVLLTTKAEIPDWILNSRAISLETEEIQGRNLPVVKINNGDAEFIGGGSVALRIGRQKGYRVGFEPNSVLEIQTLEGELIKRNHHMCVPCGANTGRMVSYSPSSEGVGLVDATFQCERNPEHSWEVRHM